MPLSESPLRQVSETVKDAGWKSVAWSGVQFAVPREWEPGRIGARHLLFESDDGPAMEIKWGPSGRGFSSRRYLRRLARRVARGGAVFQERALPADGGSPPGPVEGLGFEWKGKDGGAVGALLFCPVCRTVSLLQFFLRASGSGGDRQALQVIDSFQDHRSDGRCAWALYDIRAVLPVHFRLVGHRFEAGRFMLEFRGRRRGLMLYRWAPAGVLLKDQTLDAFAAAPGETPPETLPGYRKFIYPWIRREWVQDAYEQLRNHDMIGRREDVYLGTAWSASLGYAATGLGSSDNAWLLAGSLTSAREYRPGRQWSVGTATRGRLQSGDLRDAVLTAQARHYWQIGRRQTFYASMTGTLTEELDPDRQLLLGAEEGLRGYPLRYQTGTASALVTLEHRIYTDWYPFRFFHVGGAAFFDTGRTWGPTLSGEPPRGWLSDVGLGLRLGNSRSGLGSTIHVDFTYALNAVPGEDRFTISVDTKRGF